MRWAEEPRDAHEPGCEVAVDGLAAAEERGTDDGAYDGAPRVSEALAGKESPQCDLRTERLWRRSDSSSA